MIRSACTESISAMSTWSSASALARSARGTARSTSSESLAGRPHQRRLRASVTSPPLRSTSFSANGPAVTLSLLRAPSLKESGVPITCFGYSGEKSDLQSAYGRAKVTRTSRSLSPRSIFSMRS